MKLLVIITLFMCSIVHGATIGIPTIIDNGTLNTSSPISVTTKGDLLYHNGTGVVRLPVGTSGYVLTADTSLGVKWAAASSGSGTVTSIVAGTGLSGGTITTTGTIAIGTGGIVDSMVSATAAIAGTKTDGNFGTIDINTSGALHAGDATIATINSDSGLITTNGAGTMTAPSFIGSLFQGAFSGDGSLVTGVPLTTGITGQLPVSNGGTGLATLTTHALQVGNGTSTTTQLALPAVNGMVLIGTSSSDPVWSGQPTLGANGTAGGLITFKGATSGACVVSVNAAAGTGTTFTLPATNGTSHYPITTDGSGALKYEILPVAGGGTGIATTTAYGVLCGGTTSTGVLQSVSGVGTSGQVLTSNGVSTLPTWQPASGGISTSGTSGGIPYYSSSTTAASSALLDANQIVIGGGAGVAPFTSNGFSYDTTNGLLLPNQSAAPTPTGKASIYVNSGQLCTTNTAGTGGALIDTSTAQTISGVKNFSSGVAVAGQTSLYTVGANAGFFPLLTTSVGANDTTVRSAAGGNNIVFRYNTTDAMAIIGSTVPTVDILTGIPLRIRSGTNQRAGLTTLVAGTVTIANTTVTANTIVILTSKTAGGTIGTITWTVSVATSFTITSSSNTDTSTYSYLLIEVP